MQSLELADLATSVAADYPYVRPWTSQHGKLGWRFRRPAKNGQKEISKLLPGDPFTAEFDEAYKSLVNGQPVADRRTIRRADSGEQIARDPAHVVRIAQRGTFADAWRLLRKRPKWLALDPKTHENQSIAVEFFLTMPVAEGEPEQWRDMPVASLRRRHVEDILETIALTHPWKAKTVLIGIRKLIDAAIREEWLDANVTIGVDWSPPATRGWKAWGEKQMAQFEKRWPIGSAPRTAYALAKFLGNRRSDVALLRWDQIETRTMVIDGKRRQVTGFAFTQHKNRNRKPVDMFLPITFMLAAELAPLDRTTATVLVQDRDGKSAYSVDALSGMMRTWAHAAGLPAGYGLHGLRKALGGMADDAEVSSGQNQDMLGHASSDVNDIYRASRNRARNAVIGMDKIARLFESEVA